MIRCCEDFSQYMTKKCETYNSPKIKEIIKIQEKTGTRKNRRNLQERCEHKLKWKYTTTDGRIVHQIEETNGRSTVDCLVPCSCLWPDIFHVPNEDTGLVPTICHGITFKSICKTSQLTRHLKLLPLAVKKTRHIYNTEYTGHKTVHILKEITLTHNSK